MFLPRLSVLLLSCSIAAPALAAKDDASADAAAEADSQTIVVTGQREEYGARSTRSATRTDTDLKDIPQALTVISESQIEDQALRSIADVLTYVPGATPGTGEGNRDQITLRGNNTTADFFVDGIRDDVQYFRDLYNADRVEVLRGPNAMIFGRGGGGGIVNRVTKRSSINPYSEFSLLADSRGGVRFTSDVDHPLAPNAGVRINGVYENGESFRRDVELERYAVNPTLGLTFGSGTRIDLSYEYLRDWRTADRGVPSLSDGNAATVDRPLAGADELFFGDPEDSFSRAKVHLATLGVEHALSEELTVRNRTLFGDYDKFYQNIYPNGPATGGQFRLSAYSDETQRENLFSQTDFVWENRLAGIEQTLLLGFEIGRQKGHNQRRNGVFLGRPGTPASINVPIASPTVDENIEFRANGANNNSEASVAAFYVQDQIRLSRAFEIVAGLRFDRFGLDIDNLANGRSFSRIEELLSPRLGLIVKPVQNLSLYASYGRSYLPSAGDQFNSLDLTAQALKPEKFDNYELGAKWEPVRRMRVGSVGSIARVLVRSSW